MWYLLDFVYSTIFQLPMYILKIYFSLFCILNIQDYLTREEHKTLNMFNCAAAKIKLMSKMTRTMTKMNLKFEKDENILLKLL